MAEIVRIVWIECGSEISKGLRVIDSLNHSLNRFIRKDGIIPATKRRYYIALLLFLFLRRIEGELKDVFGQ